MALAQPKKKAPVAAAPAPTPKAAPEGPPAPIAPAKADPKAPHVQNIDLNGLDLNGRNRSPQLLYFLERANEELERASLEKRSFIPDMTKSIEDESL